MCCLVFVFWLLINIITLKKLKNQHLFLQFFNEAKKMSLVWYQKTVTTTWKKKVVLYFHHEGIWVAGMDVSSDSKTTFLKLNGNTAAITDLSDCWAMKAHD